MAGGKIVFLAAGFPVAFGFPVPTSLTADANIHYRGNLDSIRGGQTAVAVGFKKHHFGRGQLVLLIRSPWGSEWADYGNRWLPVSFARSQLARDFWTLVSEDWLDTADLFQPSAIQAV